MNYTPRSEWIIRPSARSRYDGLGRIISLPSAYSAGGTLTTSYFVNDMVHSQTQDGLTNTYSLDATGRQCERVQTGTKSATGVYHYTGDSDSPAWTQEGSAWTRNISTLGGGLGAIEKSNGETTLQLANLHGDVVATASVNPAETKLLSTQEFDEFGNPKQSSGAKYGWLGGKGRTPPSPFLGTATFRRPHQGARPYWTGSLTVSFPGASEFH